MRQDPAVGDQWRLMLASVVAACGLWAYWPTLCQIVATWASDPDYSHGYLVVPLALLFLWLRRPVRPPTHFGIYPSGLLVLVAVALLRYLAGRLYLPELDAWSVPLWIGGVGWTLLGWPIARWAAPSLAFLWFAAPLPGMIAVAISTPLQKLAAQASGFALQLFAQPAIVEGTTILLGEQTLEVERACSGLRMMYGIAALAVAMILIMRPGRWLAVGTLVAIAPLAVLINVIRITASGLLTTYFSSDAARRLTHDLAGVVVIPLAIVSFAGLLWLVRRIRKGWKDHPHRTARWLFVTSATGVVLGLAVAWWHGVQQDKSLTTLIEMARRAEESKDWSSAADYLLRYTLARPADTDQLVHLAELFAQPASTPALRLRAASLFRTAYQQRPERRELAMRAIDLAAESHNFRMAMELIDELHRETGQSDEELIGKRADVLVQYLSSPQGSRQTDYSWSDVSAALEQAAALPAYSVRRATALAVVNREFLLEPSEAERIGRADAIMNQLVVDHATDAYAWFARYQYAKRYWLGDDTKRPDADLDQALKICSNSPPHEQVEILLAAAERSHVRDRSPEAARDFLERAMRAMPTADRPYLALAELERENGGAARLEARIKVLRRGFQSTEGQSPKLVFALAQALAENGQEEEVAQVLKPIRASAPHVGDGPERTYLTTGIAVVESILQQRRGRMLEAIATLQSALRTETLATSGAADESARQIEGAWRRLGQLYRSLGWHDLAMDAFATAVRFNAGSPQARQALAEAALLAGDIETAIELNRLRVQQQPDSGDAWVALAVAQLQQQLRLPPARRDLSEARSSLARAWKLPAAKTARLVASVDQLRVEHRYADAVRLLDDALQQDDSHPELWKALAVVHLDRSDYSAAQEAVDKLAAHGGSAMETAALQVSILTSTDRTADAIRYMKQKRPELSDQDKVKATMLMAALELQMGNRAEARSILQTALAESPRELGLVEQRARLAIQDRDWVQLAKLEEQLKELEGTGGTLWKSFRAVRLLADDRSLDRAQLSEVNGLVQQVAAARPRWATGQYLLAQLAMRTGETREAVYRLEMAWKLGERSADVAVQWLGLLDQMGRNHDAERVFEQMGDLALGSPSSFDRLLPLLVQRGQSQQALAQAQQWAQDHPHDADVHVRLGRTLLIHASLLGDGGERESTLAAAEAAFREAVRLAPSDASTWTSLFAFLLQSGRPEDAVQLLERFEHEVTIGPVQIDLLLGKLNELVPRPAHAVRHWRRAVKRATEQADAQQRIAALSQAAQYFAPFSPALAERYCRQAIEIDPLAAQPLELLARLLASRAEAPAIAEARTLVDRLSQARGGKATDAQRLAARLLTLQSTQSDSYQAIGLLESLPTKDNDDKLLLARNYLRVGRLGAAYELFDEIASTTSPRVGDLVAYLEFWREHFQSDGRFTHQANEVLRRLGQLPAGLPEELRWRIRVSQATDGSESSAPQPIGAILERFWTSQPAALALSDEQSSQALLYGAYRVLLEEGHVREAVELCRRPPGNITPQFAARLFANTLMAHRIDDANQVAAGSALLEEVMEAHPEDLLLRQDAADLAALSGQARRAEALYRRIVEFDSSQVKAQSNLARILGDDPRRREEALAIVEGALADHPLDGSLLAAKGAILLQMNRAEDAIAALHEAAENAQLDAGVYLYLAIAHDQLGGQSVEEALLISAALGIDRQPLAPAERKALWELRQKYKL